MGTMEMATGKGTGTATGKGTDEEEAAAANAAMPPRMVLPSADFGAR